MILKNSFASFSVLFLSTTAELFNKKIITKKEKIFFETVCVNAENTIDCIIKEFNLSKDIKEEDFEWLMKLYALTCYLEIYDFFDHLQRGADDRQKSILDVDRTQIINHIEKILGGKDIEKFSNVIMNEIELIDRESKNINEYILTRTALVFKFFQDGGVSIPIIEGINVQEVSNKIYKDNLMNFAKLYTK